jgi:hypothetical protein
MFHFSLQSLIQVFFRLSKYFAKVTAQELIGVRTHHKLLLSDF